MSRSVFVAFVAPLADPFSVPRGSSVPATEVEDFRRQLGVWRDKCLDSESAIENSEERRAKGSALSRGLRKREAEQEEALRGGARWGEGRHALWPPLSANVGLGPILSALLVERSPLFAGKRVRTLWSRESRLRYPKYRCGPFQRIVLLANGPAVREKALAVRRVLEAFFEVPSTGAPPNGVSLDVLGYPDPTTVDDLASLKQLILTEFVGGERAGCDVHFLLGSGATQANFAPLEAECEAVGNPNRPIFRYWTHAKPGGQRGGIWDASDLMELVQFEKVDLARRGRLLPSSNPFLDLVAAEPGLWAGFLSYLVELGRADVSVELIGGTPHDQKAVWEWASAAVAQSMRRSSPAAEIPWRVKVGNDWTGRPVPDTSTPIHLPCIGGDPDVVRIAWETVVESRLQDPDLIPKDLAEWLTNEWTSIGTGSAQTVADRLTEGLKAHPLEGWLGLARLCEELLASWDEKAPELGEVHMQLMAKLRAENPPRRAPNKRELETLWKSLQCDWAIPYFKWQDGRRSP